jgi:hypothetical protein
MVTTLIADLRRLGTTTWNAIKLARGSQETWLGMPSVIPAARPDEPVRASA